MDTRWITPFTCLLSGASQSGKSTWVSRFIKHVDAMVDRKFIEIVWCFSENQPLYDTVQDKRIRFHEGIIKSSEFDGTQGPRLVILDDFMTALSTDIVDYFIKGSHHRDVSVMLLTQNMFARGSGFRDISLNSHYIVAFKMPRSVSQIAYLAMQIAPQDSKYIIESYMDATRKSYGYLL
jgi:hypothetical protein